MRSDRSSEASAIRPFTLVTREPPRDPSEDAEARMLANNEARMWALSIGIDVTITTVAGSTNCDKTCRVSVSTGNPSHPDQRTETGTDTVIDDQWEGPPQG